MTTPRPLMNDDGLVIAAYCGDCGAHAAVRADRPGLESVEAAAERACICPKPCSDCKQKPRIPGRMRCGVCDARAWNARQSARRAELLEGPRFEGSSDHWADVWHDSFYVDLDDARDSDVWAVYPCDYNALRVTEGYIESMLDAICEDHHEAIADALPPDIHAQIAGLVNAWLEEHAPHAGSWFPATDKGVVVLSEVFPDDVDADEDEVSS